MKGKKKVDEWSSSSRSRSDITSSLFQVIISFNFHLLFFHYYLLYFTHIFCLQGTSLRGHQREALMEVLIAPEQATLEQVPAEQPPQLMTDEAMNQAFGTSSYEDEDEEDEAEEVDEEEADGGHQDGLRGTGVSSATTGSYFLLTFILN
jgi:hypothetical protein